MVGEAPAASERARRYPGRSWQRSEGGNKVCAGTGQLHGAILERGDELEARGRPDSHRQCDRHRWVSICNRQPADGSYKSEEHTSELQSLRHLVCRLLLEKKKK